MNPPPSLWDRVWDPAANTAGGAVVLIVGFLVRRFRERMVTLQWSVRHQSVAFAASDATFGNVEVRHNGIPVQALSMCFVEIANESTRDLVDVDFTVSYSDGTTFLMSVASLPEAQGLSFAPAYAGMADEFMALSEAARLTWPAFPYMAKTRQYRVPVLNRGAKVDFAALVQAPPGVDPTATVVCLHKGVRLKHRPPAPVLFGVNQNRAIAIGWSMGLLAILGLRLSGTVGTLPILFGFVGGAAVGAIGAGLIWLTRIARRVIG